MIDCLILRSRRLYGKEDFP